MEKHIGDLDGSRKSASSLALEIPPDLLAKLDAWIAEQPQPRPSREDAAKQILADALAGVGGASIPVDELNASNDE